MPKLNEKSLRELTQLLEKAAQQLHISLSSEQCQQLLAYEQLILKWNSVYNLTATHEPQTLLINHIIDSLSIAPYLTGQHILDVGTGAGFPGMVLAMVFPDKAITLLDSVGKKTRFLEQVKLELKLANVSIVQERVEHFKSVPCFDLIVARAVTTVSEFIALTHHLLCPTGKILMMKGHYPTEELAETDWNYKVIPLQVPYLSKDRHLVCLWRRDTVF